MAFAAIGSTLLFAIAYKSVGARAERYPVPAFLAAVLLQPWWAAFTAGLVSHTVCAIGARMIKGKTVAPALKMALSLSIFACLFAIQVGMGMDTEAVADAVRKGEAMSWERISRSSDVGKFVAENYRPCIESRETFLQYMERHFTLAPRANAPATCKAAAIAAAKPKGRDFANSVAAMIDDVPNLMDLSADARSEIERLAGRWAF